MGDRMGWGLAVNGEHLVKHLVFSPDGNRNTLVLRTQMTASHQPHHDTLSGWIMPGAEVTQSLIQPTSGMTLLSTRSSASDVQARQFYRERFLSKGWTPLLDTSRHAQSGTDVYQKGGRLGFLTAETTGQDRHTHITMLHQSKGKSLP